MAYETVHRIGWEHASGRSVVFSPTFCAEMNPSHGSGKSHLLTMKFCRNKRSLGAVFADGKFLGAVAPSDFLFGTHAVFWDARPRTFFGETVVFLVDLPQDYALFWPLMVEAKAINLSVLVVVSRMFLKRANSEEQVASYRTVAERLLTVNSVYEFRALLTKDVRMIVAASESSVNGHKFCHQMFDAVPKNIRKVTMQHGFENVGLRNAPSHIEKYGDAIHFNADFIGVWDEVEKYPDVIEGQKKKLVPIGFVRSTSPGRVEVHSWNLSGGSKPTIMIAENLHSLRFDSEMRDRFIKFVRDVRENVAGRVVIKSHPGGDYATKNTIFKGMEIVRGALSPEMMREIDILVTPPSTMVFDSIMESIPTFIWNCADLSGLNYNPLAYSDFEEFYERVRSHRRSVVLKQWQFLYENIESVSGVKKFFCRFPEWDEAVANKLKI